MERVGTVGTVVFYTQYLTKAKLNWAVRTLIKGVVLPRLLRLLLRLLLWMLLLLLMLPLEMVHPQLLLALLMKKGVSRDLELNSHMTLVPLPPSCLGPLIRGCLPSLVRLCLWLPLPLCR